MNKINVFSYGETFRCRDFFDVDTQRNGIDVHKIMDETREGQPTYKYIGQIFGLSIPYFDEDNLNYTDFKKKVEDWLKENFW